jgi:flagellar assembly protein FliH
MQSTVIKREDLAAPQSPKPRRFNLADIEAEARGMIAAARERAKRVLAEASAQASAMREDAHREGHQKGYEEGTVAGREAGHAEAFAEAARRFAEEQASLVESCRSMVAAFEEAKARLLREARADVLELAVAIARRVLKVASLDRNVMDEAVVANAAEMLELVGAQSDPVLHVHPSNAEAMETFAGHLAEAGRTSRHVTVVADADVPPGGCVLTTREGRIDATIETQIERIAALLLDRSDAGTAIGGETREEPDATDAPPAAERENDDVAGA